MHYLTFVLFALTFTWFMVTASSPRRVIAVTIAGVLVLTLLISPPVAEAQGGLVQAIQAGAEVAIGSRWVKTELQVQPQPLYRRLFGRAFNLALRLVLGLQFKDTQCGFKAFTRRSAHAIFPLQHIERWGFDPEILFLARRFGFRVEEVGVKWSHREGTHISPLRDGLRMGMEMLRVRWYSISGKYDPRGTSLAATL